jgi:hypothetical protein
MTKMTLMIELKERGRVIGLKRIIGIESLIGRLIGRFCRALGAGIVRFCCRIVLGSVDSRRVEGGISIKVSSFAAFLVVPSLGGVAILVPLAIP